MRSHRVVSAVVAIAALSYVECGGSSSSPTSAGSPSDGGVAEGGVTVDGGSAAWPVGFWYATKLVFTDVESPAGSVDVLAGGGSYVLNVLPDMRFSYCTVFPSGNLNPECGTGTVSVQGNRLEMTPSAGDPSVAMSLPVTRSDGAFAGKSGPFQADFSGSGTPSTYTVEMACSKVTAPSSADHRGGYLGLVDWGDKAPVLADLPDGQSGTLLFPLQNSAGLALTPKPGSTGQFTLEPAAGACAPSGEVTLLGHDQYLAVTFSEATACLGTAVPGGILYKTKTGHDLLQPNANAIQNSGFEQAMTPWYSWVQDPGAAQASTALDTSEKHSGDSSLRLDITQAGSGKRVTITQDGMSVSAGQIGVVSFWAKASPPRPAAFYVNHRASPWTLYGMGGATFGGQWTRYWALVDATVTDPLVGTYFEAPDTPAGSVWVDDWTFVSYNPR